MISRLVPILALIGIIAVSGCTTGGGTSGPGIVILAWEPDLPTVFSGENVDLLLKIQNQGESRAKNVEAVLSNVEPSEWGGIFQLEKQLGDLIPSDPVTQTPGETKTSQFQDLKAPLLSKGTSFTYNPSVRIYYDYSTAAQKPITIVDKEELVKIRQQGQSLPTGTTTYSEGPLSVEIIMGNYVQTSSKFGGFEDTYDIFPVQIKITNKLWGSGGSISNKGIFGTGLYGEYDYPIEVKVIPPPGTNFVYSGYGDDCSSYQFPVELFQGKEAEITCEFEVTSPPTIKSESLIQVELDYRYSVDASTQLTVQGTKEVGGLF